MVDMPVLKDTPAKCEIYVKPVLKGHLNIPEKVSLHYRCPFITGSLTWGDSTPFWGNVPWSQGVPFSRVSFEDRFYCILAWISYSIINDMLWINKPFHSARICQLSMQWWKDNYRVHCMKLPLIKVFTVYRCRWWEISLYGVTSYNVMVVIV